VGPEIETFLGPEMGTSGASAIGHKISRISKCSIEASRNLKSIFLGNKKAKNVKTIAAYTESGY
jgi:hypothetical protein